MFDRSSRYAAVETVTMNVPGEDGAPREIAYKRRRFVPPSEGTNTLVEHTAVQGDRLDNLTARYLGDPTEFWRVCDANSALRPDELVDEIGRAVRIALPSL
jgi:hypothetical protein